MFIYGGIEKGGTSTPQQKNMELATFSCKVGRSGGCANDVSDKSSNLMNCDIC